MNKIRFMLVNRIIRILAVILAPLAVLPGFQNKGFGGKLVESGFEKLKDSKEELDEYKSENFKERLKFVDAYTAWLKKMPNKEWSKQQNKLLSRY